MPCYHPIRAWRDPSGSIVFVERGDTLQTLDLPCGRCVGCRLERSRKWAMRCMHESQLHQHSSYLTLTYDDEHLPEDGSLNYRHFQLFMKRLRKEYGKLRFYMCGEYGEKNLRPHYHAIIFGLYLPDRIPWKRTASGFFVDRSPTLERLWPYGFSSVGEVTFESAAYVARYVMKKQTGQNAKILGTYRRVNENTGEVTEALPEFNKMSLKPGIGSGWLEKYHSDVYPHDYVVINGTKCKPPRYYDEKYKKKNIDKYEEIKYHREMDGRAAGHDNTYRRLEDKERVTLARIKSLKRSI